MTKSQYKACEISVCKKYGGAVEANLFDESIEVGEYFHRSLKGQDIVEHIYHWDGCTIIHAQQGRKNDVLRLVGDKKSIDDVLAKIKGFAPELKPKWIRAQAKA